MIQQYPEYKDRFNQIEKFNLSIDDPLFEESDKKTNEKYLEIGKYRANIDKKYIAEGCIRKVKNSDFETQMSMKYTLAVDMEETTDYESDIDDNRQK